MESNGQGGRIHVSEETAEELRRKGKGDWLTARMDKIVAKGKGEMQTYWVLPRTSDSSLTASDESSEPDDDDDGCDV